MSEMGVLVIAEIGSVHDGSFGNAKRLIVTGATTIRVEPGDFYGSGRYPEPQDGKVLVGHTWVGTPA